MPCGRPCGRKRRSFTVSQTYMPEMMSSWIQKPTSWIRSMMLYPFAKLLLGLATVPYKSTAIGVWNRIASMIIIHRVPQRTLLFCTTRCNRDQSTSDCPVIMLHQPVITNVMESQGVTPVGKKRRTNPRQCGMMLAEAMSRLQK